MKFGIFSWIYDVNANAVADNTPPLLLINIVHKYCVHYKLIIFCYVLFPQFHYLHVIWSAHPQPSQKNDRPQLPP